MHRTYGGLFYNIQVSTAKLQTSVAELPAKVA
jgi:hypothetical protein